MDEHLCKKHGLNLQEALFVLFLRAGQKQRNSVEEDLVQKGILINLDGNFFITPKGTKLAEALILDVSKDINDDEITELAKQLKSLFPKGKKDGKWYWADGIVLIVKRLKLFYKKYGYYSPETIVQATQSYLKDYENDDKGRKLLKYFICKDKVVDDDEGKHIEFTSDLLNYIENAGEVEVQQWESTVV